MNTLQRLLQAHESGDSWRWNCPTEFWVFFTSKTVWTREKKKALFLILVKIIQFGEYYSCCDWSSPTEVLECRHMDDVTVNMAHGFENVCEHYFGLSKRRPRKSLPAARVPLLCFYHILTSSAGDLLLNRPTTTWNLFVKSVAGKGNACLIVWPMGGRYHEQLKNPPVQVPMNSQDLSSYFCSSGIWGQLPPYFGGGLVQVRERFSTVCPRAQRTL